eukprot:GFYU01011077.1.p1 GENE.GFYU01011077.1~~GFYU01011077.1.p1  ORF type:complete len:319 (-),score=77.36 GFYU01011077.1:200-1156(-)
MSAAVGGIQSCRQRALVCCYAIISEGRKAPLLESLAAGLSRNFPNVSLIRAFYDTHYNRSSYNLVGLPDSIGDAAFHVASVAASNLSMNTCADPTDGAHPFLGVTDLLPFYPLGSTSLEECAEIARGVGRRIGEDLDCSVKLFGHADAQGRTLVRLRKLTPFFNQRLDFHQEFVPEFGPHTSDMEGCTQYQFTAVNDKGVTMVGAMPYAMNFNVTLDTSDVQVAQTIARAVRGSSVGKSEYAMEGVQTMGLRYGEKVEVGCNIIDTSTVDVETLKERIRVLAEEMGTTVAHTYVINDHPDVLYQQALTALQLTNPSSQ